MNSDAAVRINVLELRAAVDRLLDAVEAAHGAAVDLAADHYWGLDAAESFDLENEPHVEARQLSEDVEDTRDMLTRAGGEVWLWHDAAHIAGIFLRLAALDSPRRLPRE
jgi:hypothetical protein